jgi:hypothetical protein
MMKKDERIQRFFELCNSSSFPHREELLRGIKAGKYSFTSNSTSEVPSEQMLDIYKVRVDILSEKKSLHAQRLKNDVWMFVNELEKTPNEKVKFWKFSVDESSSYVVFEGSNSQRILGCLLVVDRRKVSEADWQKLWSEE